MFTKSLIASALAIAVATPAMAADESGWAGPYVGVNVGYGGSKVEYPASAVIGIGGTPSTDITIEGVAHQTSSGVIGGGEIGYNFDLGSVVLGVEADIAASGIKGETSLAGTASGPLAGAASAGIVSSLNYLGTVRVRAGLPIADGRFMPYVTGGFAYGQVKTEASGEISGTLGSTPVDLAGGVVFKDDRTGWTPGAGADYAITDNIAFRAEYLYVDLGSTTLIDETYNALGIPIDVNLQMKTTANVMRVGLTYRF